MYNLIDLVLSLLNDDRNNPLAIGITGFVLLAISLYLGTKAYSIYIHKSGKVKKSELSMLYKLMESKDKIIKGFGKIGLIEDLFYKYTKIRTNVEEITLYMNFYKEIGGSFSLKDMKEIKSYLKVINNQVTIKYGIIDRFFGFVFFCLMMLFYFSSVLLGVIAFVFNLFAEDGLSLSWTLGLFLGMVLLLLFSSIFMYLGNPIRRAKYFKKILDKKREDKGIQKNEKKKTKVKVSFGNQWGRNDTKTLFICFISLVFWFMFEDKLLDKYNILVVSRYLSFAEDHIIYFWIVFVLLLIYAIFGRVSYWKHKRFIPYKYLIIPSFFIGIYILYWWQNKYSSYSAYCGFGVVDWLVLFIVFFLVIGYCFNQIQVVTIGLETNEKLGLKRDEPIDSFEHDSFEFGEKVKAFVWEVFNTDCSKRLSVGINGKWGEGKSSYANLMKAEFESEKYQDEFIVLDFNPRHSKDVNSIQFDFFQLLYEKLSIYDSRFSSSFKKYLKAIQVFDKHSIIDFIQIGGNAFFDKNDDKREINQAIDRIGKRVVIFIEDMDRLLAEEIIEVFKLIDGTAAFSNFIFITCFDKEHVSKVISNLYVEGDTYFSDKFFDVEKRIPLINRDTLLEGMKNLLYSNDNKNNILFNDEEKKEIEQTIKNHKKLLGDILVQPRDVKRFVNMFKQPYLYFRENIVFEDYLLLTLLKYKYNDVYRQLFYKKIVYRGNIFFFDDQKELNHNQMYLNIKETDEIINNNDYKIVKILFEKKEAQFNSINHSSFFMLYFREHYNSNFSLVAMKDLLMQGLNDNVKTIDSYIESDDNGFFNEFLSKVFNLKIGNDRIIDQQSVFSNYMNVLIYVISRLSNHFLKGVLNDFLKIEKIKILKDLKLIQSTEEFKKEMIGKLKGSYPNYPNEYVCDLLLEQCRGYRDNENYVNLYILSKEELLAINKEILNDLIVREPVFNEKHLNFLYTCMDYIDKESSRRIYLDQESCNRVNSLIKNAPKNYFTNFVRLGMITNSIEINNITCEPFWFQIFVGDKKLNNVRAIGNVFKEFISKTEFDEYDKISTVRNFWELYEANEYSPIYFEHQGNVQEKIDNEFKEEKKQLEKILELKQKFDKVEFELKDFKNELCEMLARKKKTKLFEEDVEEFCKSTELDKLILLEGLNQFSSLIKEANDSEQYWLSLDTLKRLKNFDLRILKLDGSGMLPHIIKTVENSMKIK